MEQASERALLIAQEIAQRTATDHYRMILNEQRVPDATGSKIGGKPYWPVGMQYPVDMKGNKMLFVMQVNCEEAGFKSPLPESGMLQWFISMNTERMYGCLGNYNEDGSGFAIVYHDRIGECGTLTEVPTHDSIDDDMLSPVKREVAIDFVPESTVMGVSDGRFNRLFFDIVKEITGISHTDKQWYQYLDNSDCLYFERQVGMKRPCHQVLGFPVYTQDEARRDIQKHDTLLFQLDSQFSSDDNKELVMWGDMGSGYIFINNQDLIARDFSQAYYCWDCG